MYNKILIWYKKQTSTTKGFIWVAALLVVGIALRWEFIIENMTRGFSFFKSE